jgi:hypothetical protein
VVLKRLPDVALFGRHWPYIPTELSHRRVFFARKKDVRLMSGTDIEFIDQLVRQHPQLRSLYLEHSEYYEALLPHVLFGDISRYVIAQSADLDRNRYFLGSFMSAMELAILSNNESVTNLVQVSFIENLIGEYDLMDRLETVTSPTFLRMIKDIISYDLNRSLDR